jgi:hypothetical protein
VLLLTKPALLDALQNEVPAGFSCFIRYGNLLTDENLAANASTEA